MIDRQVTASSAEPRIFLVSSILHCVSLTVLVYLRSSFGFGFLRPKSVFFAFSWAFVLYAIYARIDGLAWREHHTLILFGAGTVILYWIHLLVAFIREWRESGEHEQYSGLPHAVCLIRRGRATPNPAFERIWRLWGEPTLVFSFALAMRFIGGGQGLSRWLLVVATCLWSKEALNCWFQLRGRKRQSDLFTDTENAVDPSPTTNPASEPPLATRKTRVKRSRNTNATAADVSSNSKLAQSSKSSE